MIYFVLLLSGLLFAFQFATDKYYQLQKPLGERHTIAYALIGKIAASVLFLAVALISGVAFWCNFYTFIIGAGIALLGLAVTVYGMRVLAIGSVSTYTVSIMIGGMAVPAVFGAAVLSEPFGINRIFAFVMIK